MIALANEHRSKPGMPATNIAIVFYGSFVRIMKRPVDDKIAFDARGLTWGRHRLVQTPFQCSRISLCMSAVAIRVIAAAAKAT